MKYLNLVLIVLSIFILTACDDDDQFLLNCDPIIIERCDFTADFTEVVDTCIALNLGGNGIEAVVLQRDTNFWIPFIRPQSGGETFAYVRVERDFSVPGSFEFNRTIWQHDLCKGESELVNADFDVTIMNDLDITNTDWIVFMGVADRRIHKMKINGDSLTQVLPEQQCTTPIWIEENEKILCNCRFENPLSFHSVVLNISGEILDTLQTSISYFDSRFDKVASTGRPDDVTNYIGYVNLENLEFISLLPWTFDEHGRIFDMAWLDDSHIVWIDPNGIHQVNINTGEYTVVKEVCENLAYRTLAVIPDQNELLLAARNAWNISSDSIYGETNIIHFDLDTGEERFINLE